MPAAWQAQARCYRNRRHASTRPGRASLAGGSNEPFLSRLASPWLQGGLMTIRLDRTGATLLLLAAALPAGCGNDELFTVKSLAHGLAIRQEATLALGQDG